MRKIVEELKNDFLILPGVKPSNYACETVPIDKKCDGCGEWVWLPESLYKETKLILCDNCLPPSYCSYYCLSY